ncbi:hypothetical protein [Janthinobacterium lividum]|uniref:DUF2783 domain-containing protein n=1 Tax=Janthinobacterium lividum TaxID=29581 RepID=A0ABU0XN05_9BURK|nr:hypothetical protein [Janthinobacterium lividum]MDQ4624908.1 hypothetical protein [Janthinobacterium lividum]MDQ4673489.1 hypothetical protein [Janthinobacterium lividum]MDQ4684219.1 hypothetical protein [Janthinobacterium lividum]
MTDIELDNLYTELCHTMSGLGEQRSPLFLARFALLAMGAIGKADVVQGLLRDAADGLGERA